MGAATGRAAPPDDVDALVAVILGIVVVELQPDTPTGRARDAA
ncbi:MAG: hypothetical protein WCQ50_19720 [Spirochaetota bacterium]